jgi:hypothetical protein
MDYRNKVGSCGLDTSGSEQGPVMGSCEQANKPSGSIKDMEFKRLNDHWLLKKDFSPHSQSVTNITLSKSIHEEYNS